MRQVPVLISGNFSGEQLAAIKAVHPALLVYGEPGGLAFEPPSGLDETELTYPKVYPVPNLDAILREVEVVVASRLPADILERTPRLKWVQALGAGIDHLAPASVLSQADFLITNVSGVHAVPMSETVLLMLLDFAKSWQQLSAQKRRHEWGRKIVGELHGKTLGLLGLGRIGREVARVGSAMGMRVIGLRRRDSASESVPNVTAVYSRGDLTAVLGQSDFVVCCLPFTDETYHLIGEEQFRAMKPTAYFVNVGRGQVVDEKALVRALQEGLIAGAGLDVFEEEPLPTASPLWDFPNVLISPHQGGDTDLYMERTTELVCENLRRYAEGEPLLNVVSASRGY
ncbi:MAG: D-2-hydroxyacid dehydrogenase [Chloroflexota bacterium]